MISAQITIEGVTYPLDLTPGRSEQQVQAGPHTVNLLVNHVAIVVIAGTTWHNYHDTDLGSWLACSKTGELYRPLTGKSRIGEIMQEQHVCFNVAFWLELAERHQGNPYWFRIAGHSYMCAEQSICKDRAPRPPSKERGYYGRTMRIRLLGSGEVLTIDDLWHQGTLPAWIAPDWPDNAEFVTGN